MCAMADACRFGTLSRHAVPERESERAHGCCSKQDSSLSAQLIIHDSGGDFGWLPLYGQLQGCTEVYKLAHVQLCVAC